MYQDEYEVINYLINNPSSLSLVSFNINDEKDIFVKYNVTYKDRTGHFNFAGNVLDQTKITKANLDVQFGKTAGENNYPDLLKLADILYTDLKSKM